jgi:hypothetical protein
MAAIRFFRVITKTITLKNKTKFNLKNEGNKSNINLKVKQFPKQYYTKNALSIKKKLKCSI